MPPRNRTLFNESLRLLLGGHCSSCGVKARKRSIRTKTGAVHRVSNLEFHHKDPGTKLYTVTAAPTRALAIAELQKCVLLCSKCHDNYHECAEFFDSVNSCANDNDSIDFGGYNDV